VKDLRKPTEANEFYRRALQNDALCTVLHFSNFIKNME